MLSLITAFQISLPKLESLLLYSNDLTDSTMYALSTASANGGLNRLRILCLQNNVGVTRNGKAAVKVAMAALARGRGQRQLKVFI